MSTDEALLAGEHRAGSSHFEYQEPLAGLPEAHLRAICPHGRRRREVPLIKNCHNGRENRIVLSIQLVWTRSNS